MKNKVTMMDIVRLSRTPGWINQIPEEDQDEVCMLHEELLRLLKDIEKGRYEEVRKVKQALREWRESPEMKDFAKEARLRYLKGQEQMILTMFRNNKVRYVEVMRDDPESIEVGWLLREAKYLVKQLESIKKEREARESNRKDEITPEMVYRAREYPIEQIVRLERNGRAKCVFHGGEDGNMDIRKNFAYCYVCNSSGDSIKIYMQVNDVNFKQAVLAMQ